MNFKCKKCGKCCSNYLPLIENEIKIMKKLAKKEKYRLVNIRKEIFNEEKSEE